MASMNLYISLFSIVFLASRSALAEYGSCRLSRKCCDGKDLNCMVNEEEDDSGNQILALSPQGDYSEPCYCDHGCLELGDCCPDFKDYCGVIDCRVSDWSDWSPCTADCGSGTSMRKREILHPPSNGGEECPVMEEKKPCKVTNCGRKKLDSISSLRETAMLLPAKYAKKHRRQARKYDVRENLKSYKSQEGGEKDSKYCVLFKVDKTMHACRQNEDTSMLSKGRRVCVSCDSKAQRDHLGGRCTGHGAEGRRTRFKNILTPRCRGRWTRMQIIEGDCPCPGGADLIFV